RRRPPAPRPVQSQSGPDHSLGPCQVRHFGRRSRATPVHHEPRIALGGGGAAAGRGAQDGITSIGISASMMAPGNDKIVADRVYEILSEPRPPKPAHQPVPPATDLSGVWDVQIDFIAGSARHTLSLRQEGNHL